MNKLDTENFIVRPKRKYIETYSERERWESLSKTDVLDITEHLAHLPYDDDDEEMARRFDLLVLNLQLAILETAPGQDRYQRQIVSLMGNLEEKEAIPSVAKEMELILEMQQVEYWQHVTLPMLESARKRLRDLIKFIDRRGGQENVYTKFMDDIGEAMEIEGLVQSDPKLKNYRLRVESFIREHETHPTIQRLRNNEALRAGDIDSLESILFAEEGPGTREEFNQTFGEDQPLGELIRRIVGLDRSAAKAAFAEFLSEGTYPPNQIRFIDLIVDHLVANGVMDPKQLFDTPFTEEHHEGVAGIFGDDATAVIAAITEINQNAGTTSAGPSG